MKLSIIVPVYNCKDKIIRLLSSVLSSDAEFELICVNDGSTDNTVSIIESFHDRRLVVYSKENQGTFKTWQYGLSKASGDYVTIFDQDDYVDSDCIDVIFRLIEENSADVFFSPYYFEKEDGTKKPGHLPFKEGLYKDKELETIRPVLLSGRVPYAKFSKVIRKEVLQDQVMNTYSGTVTDFEDWLTMIQVFGRISSIYISNRAYYHYILYSNTNSVSKSTRSYRKNFNSLLTMVDFLQESTYVRLNSEKIDMIYFYACRILLNKCIKIKEFSLARQILHDERFERGLKKANIPKYEKLLLSMKKANIYYCCYLLKKMLGN